MTQRVIIRLTVTTTTAYDSFLCGTAKRTRDAHFVFRECRFTGRRDGPRGRVELSRRRKRLRQGTCPARTAGGPRRSVEQLRHRRYVARERKGCCRSDDRWFGVTGL